MTNIIPVDTKLDLVLKRELNVPVSLVWRGLTEPELLKQWFCPKPWGVSDCRLDLRPGGEFYTVMRDPDGNEFPSTGCILEVISEKRLTWTSTMVTDFRPAKPVSADDKECANISMTAIISIEAIPEGTAYTAHVMHATPEQSKLHEEMGFSEGWGTTVKQLEELLNQEIA
ncbi:MAG: polyketide cyclase [Alphaproteobacteria bacterium]|nr:polyketide cyclase [Alphaproteobacteria bacterium]